MKLDPSESFNNSGSLRVEVLDAADLPAGDRNGFSDPFCRFVLNGKEVYKTKIQKKTLHPAWNEFFEVPIRSRTAAIFEVNVFDWDFGDKADFLGKAAINLDVLDPLERQEVNLGLDGKSGAIRLRMLFKPEFVMRSRQGSSTFSGTFSTPGKIVGAPVKTVGKGAVAITGGLVKGASFMGRGFKRGNSRTASEQLEETPTSNGVGESSAATNGVNHESPTVSQTPTAIADKELPATPTQRRSRSFGAVGSPAGASSAETGTATISVISAAGFPVGTKVEVKIVQETSKGPKEVLRTKHIKTKTGEVDWEKESSVESKKISCSADSQFKIGVYDHATFGGSDELGETPFFIDDQGQGGQKTIKVGAGSVVVASSFEPNAPGTAGSNAVGSNGADNASTIGSAPSSPNAGGLGVEKKSGGTLRRSFMGRRDRERSATPGQ